MRAVVFHGVGDIRLENVPEPKIEAGDDAIVRLTASAICGTDLHMVRGTLGPMRPGTILGHEGVGVIEEVGREVKSFRNAERVVVCSTIACGICSYCRAGYFSQCSRSNPNGPEKGTAFFGGPEETGPIDGLQAERARVPFAAATLVPVPDGVSDDQAILTSDIFPTGYFGADLAAIHPGATVAVFGCGPVGQMAILSARLMDAGRIFAVDAIPSRLDLAAAQGAEAINYEQEDPIEAIHRLTAGIGVDRAIDAVGVDANRPHHGPAAKALDKEAKRFDKEVEEIAPKARPRDGHWRPGDAPSLVLAWCARALARAGTLAIIGVYPEAAKSFPVGLAMSKNLRIVLGNCPHRRYIPRLLDMIAAGRVDPARWLTKTEPLTDAVAAYEAFDQRQPGWLKVKLEPARERRLQAA